MENDRSDALRDREPLPRGPVRRPPFATHALLTITATLALTACDGATGPESPPPAPTALAVAPLADTGAVLSWALPTDRVTEIHIDRATGAAAFATLATVAGTATTFSDAGLAPKTTYRYRIQACNEAGCSPFTEPVGATTFATLVIQDVPLPGGVVGSPFQAAIFVTGGGGEATFAIVAGTLPPGLSLDPRGILAGTPTAEGTFPFAVRAGSEDGQSATAELVLVVRAKLVFVTTTLPTGAPGQPYNAALEAAGGDGDYSWFLDGGSLPAGTSLSGKTGIISGVPVTDQTTLFVARVRSGDGQTASRQLRITIGDGGRDTLRIVTAVLPPGLQGAPWRPNVQATGGDGSAITFDVVAGALPPGVSLGEGGRFSGSPVTTGTFSFTLRALAGPESADASYTVAVVPHRPDRFDVTRMDVVPVSPAISAHVDAAIQRWQEALTGDLPADSIPRGFFDSDGCDGFGQSANGASIDDLLIVVNIDSIDGIGSVLGQAGPCGVRDDSFLPVLGVLTLDAEDLDPLVGSRTLTDVLFHEIGHILGFGTLWGDLATGAGTEASSFNGPGAIAEYQALGGIGPVPLETEGGPGTADSHWSEDVFGDEIMTGFVAPPGTPNPLSRVTIASMEDLGYTVDLAAADAYALPAGAASVEAAVRRLGRDVVLTDEVRVLPPRGGGR